jgi:zinc transport system substrate-binding protein
MCILLSRARIFVYAGKAMEPWVGNVIRGAGILVTAVVDAGEGIALEDGDDDCGHETDHNGGRHEEETHGKDPHIWMDMENAQKMVDNIAIAFSSRDPLGREVYLKNASAYKSKMADMDKKMRSELSLCPGKTFIYAGHFTFGYLCRRYGLKQLSPFRSFSSDAEPAPREVAALIKFMRQNKLKYVYSEGLQEPRVARLIASESGAKVLPLYGAHNISKDDYLRGIDFIALMGKNLVNLKKGLGCGE